jgi:hypothetical protein
MNKKGVLYVLHHPSFASYGPDVYKLGQTKNIQQRLKGYATSFVGECKFLYVTQEFQDCTQAERILFYLLRTERLASNREFFNLSFPRIKLIMQKLEHLESTNKTAISFLYSQVCLEIVPLKVKQALISSNGSKDRIDELIQEEVDRWTPTEYTQNLPFDEFLERFRFRPKTDTMYKTYKPPEQMELFRLIQQQQTSTNDDDDAEDVSTFVNDEHSSNLKVERQE